MFMAATTEIAWADATHNQWTGCTRVSPGCDNCYAAERARRFVKTFGSWEPGAPRKRNGTATLRQPHRWNRTAAAAGLRRRVFSASMSDVFDNQAPPEWRRELFDLIRATPALDWQVLTKRPQNAAKMRPPDWGAGYPNVWVGVTAENQAEADRRIPILQAIPAHVRFLSCEPLLEPLRPDLAGIGWVICGGESGHSARPMSPDWARLLRDQRAAAGVPFFMKQMSGTPGKVPAIPADLMIRQFPV
jgi:protein gp37